MDGQVITRGENIYRLESHYGLLMTPSDLTRLLDTVKRLMEFVPDSESINAKQQGLLLGLVQSGKTAALTASIAMAADNGYRCFIVITSDNIAIYKQTLDRLKSDLQGIQVIEWRDDPTRKHAQKSFDEILYNATAAGSGVVIVTTKNALVLRALSTLLEQMQSELGGRLPSTFVIDDEADEASLDTRTSQRAHRPESEPGQVNAQITQIRSYFPCCTYLQVTATPQALFLQRTDSLHRPRFTILVEPGEGYVGGNTFFSLVEGQRDKLVRYISQGEVDLLIESPTLIVPESLKQALCIFFVGATAKYWNERGKVIPDELKYTFLCHISQFIAGQNRGAEAIRVYCRSLQERIRCPVTDPLYLEACNELYRAYRDVQGTVSERAMPSFNEIVNDLRYSIVGIDIQLLNSEQPQERPEYVRRFNILIGGEKLARGVTIKNLLVTYYGRQAAKTSIDTMLQHARMYGYRQTHLDVTRLFVTSDVEDRFQRIHESEQALWNLIRNHPEDYRAIKIGMGLSATRNTVLSLDEIGTYTAAGQYYPRWPVFSRHEVAEPTQKLDEILDHISPKRGVMLQITFDQAIELINITKSMPLSGLWSNRHIISALETLKSQEYGYNDIVRLYVRDSTRRPGSKKRGNMRELPSLLPSDTLKKADPMYPTLFMSRLDGNGWDGSPFWVPEVVFPEGNFAITFNLE